MAFGANQNQLEKLTDNKTNTMAILKYLYDTPNQSPFLLKLKAKDRERAKKAIAAFNENVKRNQRKK